MGSEYVQIDGSQALIAHPSHQWNYRHYLDFKGSSVERLETDTQGKDENYYCTRSVL